MEARLESLSDTFELWRTQGQCSALSLVCEKPLRTIESDARQETRFCRVAIDASLHVFQPSAVAWAGEALSEWGWPAL